MGGKCGLLHQDSEALGLWKALLQLDNTEQGILSFTVVTWTRCE